MKYIIGLLCAIILALVIYICIGLGYTRKLVWDHDLFIDTHGKYNNEVAYLQFSSPDDISSFRMISDDGKELDVNQITDAVRTFNKTIGLNYSAGINRENSPLPENVWSKLDESPQTQNDIIHIWLDEKGKVKTFGINLDGGMRMKLRGVSLSIPEDAMLSTMIEKLHIDMKLVQRQYIFPWEN